MRFHSPCANVGNFIYAHEKKYGFPCTNFAKLKYVQQKYVQISDMEFRTNRKINVEILRLLDRALLL